MPPTGVSCTYGQPVERPPVERYARTSLTVDGVTIEPGIQYERGEDSNLMSHRLRDATRRAVNSIRIPLTRIGFDSIAVDIEREIIALWPRRAYFIEIHDDAAGHWTQVFQPFGVPMNRRRSFQSTVTENSDSDPRQEVHDRPDLLTRIVGQSVRTVDHGPSKLAPYGWCGAGHEVAPALRADGSCPLCGATP